MNSALVEPFCAHCGYTLRGLQSADACPECGARAETGRHRRLLINAPHQRIESLQRAASLTLYASAAFVGLGILWSLFRSDFPEPGTAETDLRRGAAAGLGGGACLAAILAVFGWWRLTSPVWPHDEGPARLRRLGAALRASTLPFVVAYAALVAVDLAGPRAASPRTLLFMALWLVSGALFFALSVAWLRTIAAHLPSRPLFQRARRERWAGPFFILTGVLCLWMGPLVASLLYLDLLRIFRGALVYIRSQQTPA